MYSSREINTMNAREVYDAIQRNGHNDQQQALFELLLLVQTLSTAVLELAGTEQLKTGNNPLASSSRLILSEFIGAPKEGHG